MKSNDKFPFYVTHGIALLIFAACLMMAGPMRDGFPVGGSFFDRLRFIDENLFIWKVGWIMWMFSALGLLLFSTFLRAQLPHGYKANFGLALVACGIPPDLFAEVIYAFVIPFSYTNNVDLDVIRSYEYLSIFMTGFLGNGLYNLGGLWLTVMLIQTQRLPIWVSVMGLTAWFLGIGLSVSVALEKFTLAELMTASSMGLSTLWMLVVAHVVFKPR